jgi:hypothetical protein
LVVSDLPFVLPICLKHISLHGCNFSFPFFQFATLRLFFCFVSKQRRVTLDHIPLTCDFLLTFKHCGSLIVVVRMLQTCKLSIAFFEIVVVVLLPCDLTFVYTLHGGSTFDHILPPRPSTLLFFWGIQKCHHISLNFGCRCITFHLIRCCTRIVFCKVPFDRIP